MIKWLLRKLTAIVILLAFTWQVLPQPATAKTKPKNVIYILSDDHRYDFMGFTGKVPGLQTPNMDRLAKEGAHFKNAFVTTALCSPSRASILTGQYAHTHTVVDNEAPGLFSAVLTKGRLPNGFPGQVAYGRRQRRTPAWLRPLD